MKKELIVATIAVLLSSQAFADNNREKVIILGGFGEVSADDIADTDVTMYNVSVTQAVNKGEFGLSAGMDFGFRSDTAHNGSTTYNLDTTVFAPSIGFAYGMSDNFSIVPSVGMTFLNAEVSDNHGNSAEGNENGFNIGADLLYRADNDFTFGLGMKKHSVEDVDFTQVHFKFGYAF